ncbi:MULTISPECIES: hypothetical protein [unclassified Flavobacterium]|jgi:hypothetical protein|nr:MULTISPECIES: hypothetical protein [unclassified Flavobacterium]
MKKLINNQVLDTILMVVFLGILGCSSDYEIKLAGITVWKD